MSIAATRSVEAVALPQRSDAVTLIAMAALHAHEVHLPMFIAAGPAGRPPGRGSPEGRGWSVVCAGLSKATLAHHRAPACPRASRRAARTPQPPQWTQPALVALGGRLAVYTGAPKARSRRLSSRPWAECPQVLEAAPLAKIPES
jgi:hypothetical protein